MGTYRRIPVAVCSTGIGCPSTAIAVEEVITAGAQILIRVGTCGGAWRRDVPISSLVIPTASVRDEGTTLEYMPLGFPAVADFSVVQALRDAATARNETYTVGINRTHDAFYGSDEAITRWGRYLVEPCWRKNDTPILSSEMESAVLFMISSMRNVRAGAVFAVNANPESLKDRVRGKRIAVVAEASPQKTARVVDRAITVALEAIVQLHHTQSL